MQFQTAFCKYHRTLAIESKRGVLVFQISQNLINISKFILKIRNSNLATLRSFILYTFWRRCFSFFDILVYLHIQKWRKKKKSNPTMAFRVAQNFKHEKFIWDLADLYSLRKRNAEKCKNFLNQTTFRYAHLRSKFYYITRLRDMGEDSNIVFFSSFSI